MIERFLEQYPAIQAASMDPRLRKAMDRDRLEKITDEDFKKAEDFIRVMKIMYTSTLCVSSGKHPTSGQILPILAKLESNFIIKEEDTIFTATLKEKVWNDISKRYQGDSIRMFLEEATAMDPRFKNKAPYTTWARIEMEVNKRFSNQWPVELTNVEDPGEEKMENYSDGEYSDNTATNVFPDSKRPKLSALQELFAEEDHAVTNQTSEVSSPRERVEKELQNYRDMPSLLTSSDPVAWWWEKKDLLPMLSDLACKYMCVQASSTPSERVFSTAGDNISHERASILPEKADMLIFLKKNS